MLKVPHNVDGLYNSLAIKRGYTQKRGCRDVKQWHSWYKWWNGA